MENIVVDFSGFQFEGHYIIKEFAVARILDKSIEVEDPMLINTTALPIDSDALYFSDKYQMFFNHSRILWGSRGNHTREDILAKMKSLRRHNIYLRDEFQALFLAKYLNVSPNSFKLLSSFHDFNSSDRIMKTYCENHINRKGYCAKNNVMNMADWLKNKLKRSSRSKERLAVINFVGKHRDPTKHYTFKIEKLRVYCFDNNGTMISNKLIAPIIPRLPVNTTAEDVHNHFSYYRQKYGNNWGSADVTTSAMKSQLNKILLSNKIEFVFVKNSTQKIFLQELLDSSLNVIALEGYGYVQDTNLRDNLDQEVKEMVDFVLREKIYETIRQQNEGIEIADNESTSSSDTLDMEI